MCLTISGCSCLLGGLAAATSLRLWVSIFFGWANCIPERGEVDNKNPAVQEADRGKGHRQESRRTGKCFCHCTRDLKNTNGGAVKIYKWQEMDQKNMRIHDSKNRQATLRIFHSTMKEEIKSRNERGDIGRADESGVRKRAA
jgi:hypothetical protein